MGFFVIHIEHSYISIAKLIMYVNEYGLELYVYEFETIRFEYL